MVYGRRRARTPVSLGRLRASQGYSIVGAFGDGLGNAIASAGDVNRDDVPDQLIGAMPASHLRPDGGAAYVVHGRRRHSSAPIALPALGRRGYRMDGFISFGVAGSSVANAGDVSGDGVPDALVGAPGQTGAPYGHAFVVYGRRVAPRAAINLGRLGRSGGYRIRNPVYASVLGYSVAGAGDVNGDRVPDQLVGAPGAGVGGGNAYVVFGRRPAPAAPIDVTRLPRSRGYDLEGTRGSSAGWEVANAGDTTGDGVPDALVMAPNSSVLRGTFGAVYLAAGLR